MTAFPTAAPPRPARRLAPLAAVLLGLAACQGSDPQQLTLLSSDEFYGDGAEIGGGGASPWAAYTLPESGFFSRLRLVRHDAGAPDQLTFVGDLDVPWGVGITRIAVGGQTMALVAGGQVGLIDLGSAAHTIVPVPALSGVSDVAVNDSWILVIVGEALTLVNRAAPEVAIPISLGEVPTAILAVGGRFLAFSSAGYATIETSGLVASVRTVADATLRNVRVAYAAADGASAMVAGPGDALSESKVLRLDLTDPGVPVVARQVALPGTFVAFAWDGADTSVLAFHGEGDQGFDGTFHQGWIVREGTDAFRASGTPLPTWFRGGHPLAAHAGRLLAMDLSGFLFLRIE